MKQLYSFILEKLKINSKSQVNSKTNDDPLSWEVGDIFWFDGFHIEFYKIIKRTSKQFELHNIPVKLISGYFNSAKYTCEPDIDNESKIITKGRISKDNILIIDKRKGYTGLWEGKPIEGCGLK